MLIKKLFLLFMLFGCSLTIQGQIIRYQAQEFAFRYVNQYGSWTEWSDWERSTVIVTINVAEDIIMVNTATPQTYVVVAYDGLQTDASGGKQAIFRVIDQDYDKGTVRLRIEKNGNSQMYVDFSNVSWVYSGLVRW